MECGCVINMWCQAVTTCGKRLLTLGLGTLHDQQYGVVPGTTDELVLPYGIRSRLLRYGNKGLKYLR